MNKRLIKVLKNHRYGGKWRKVGTEYSAPEKFANLIVTIGKAEFVLASAKQSDTKIAEKKETQVVKETEKTEDSAPVAVEDAVQTPRRGRPPKAATETKSQTYQTRDMKADS